MTIAYCNFYAPGRGATLIGFDTLEQAASVVRTRSQLNRAPLIVTFDDPAKAMPSPVRLGDVVRDQRRISVYLGRVRAVLSHYAWVAWDDGIQEIVPISFLTRDKE